MKNKQVQFIINKSKHNHPTWTVWEDIYRQSIAAPRWALSGTLFHGGISPPCTRLIQPKQGGFEHWFAPKPTMGSEDLGDPQMLCGCWTVSLFILLQGKKRLVGLFFLWIWMCCNCSNIYLKLNTVFRRRFALPSLSIHDTPIGLDVFINPFTPLLSVHLHIMQHRQLLSSELYLLAVVSSAPAFRCSPSGLDLKWVCSWGLLVISTVSIN